MQTTMTLEACCRCGQPIAPGEPAMQTASVDIIGGRAVSSPVNAYHLKGRCLSTSSDYVRVMDQRLCQWLLCPANSYPVR